VVGATGIEPVTPTMSRQFSIAEMPVKSIKMVIPRNELSTNTTGTDGHLLLNLCVFVFAPFAHQRLL
jgi:hypothetical protein